MYYDSLPLPSLRCPACDDFAKIQQPDPDGETLRLAEQSPAYTTGADGD